MCLKACLAYIQLYYMVGPIKDSPEQTLIVTYSVDCYGYNSVMATFLLCMVPTAIKMSLDDLVSRAISCFVIHCLIFHKLDKHTFWKKCAAIFPATNLVLRVKLQFVFVFFTFQYFSQGLLYCVLLLLFHIHRNSMHSLLLVTSLIPWEDSIAEENQMI